MDSASEKKNNKMKGEKEEAKKCHCTRKTGEKKEMKRKSNKVTREKGQRQKAQAHKNKPDRATMRPQDFVDIIMTYVYSKWLTNSLRIIYGKIRYNAILALSLINPVSSLKFLLKKSTCLNK